MVNSEPVRLAFGDIVQFGNTDPESEGICWFSPEVVASCAASDSVEAFPIASDEDGNAHLDLPGTTWGTEVRILGKLSLTEVRELLLPDTEPRHRPIFLGIYVTEDKAMAPAREYSFRLHND